MTDVIAFLMDLGCPKETHGYLADGVYAGIDGARQMWLVAERDGEYHAIALEIATLDALEEYTFKHADTLTGFTGYGRF
jgi:hypothetical protein